MRLCLVKIEVEILPEGLTLEQFYNKSLHRETDLEPFDIEVIFKDLLMLSKAKSKVDGVGDAYGLIDYVQDKILEAVGDDLGADAMFRFQHDMKEAVNRSGNPSN